MGRITPQPVERFAKMATPFSIGIDLDATGFLKSRTVLDDKYEGLWVPKSEESSSLYRPV